LLDWLGVLNSWGNEAERVPLPTHSTNTQIPLSLDVGELLSMKASMDRVFRHGRIRR